MSITLYELGDKPTIRAEFRDKNGLLANPTTVVVTVRKPDGSTAVVANANASTGIFEFEPTIDQEGPWRWEARGTGVLVQVQAGSFVARDALSTRNLIQPELLEAMLGQEYDDARAFLAVWAASAAIRAHTGRSFGLANVTETRTYTYDGSGWLDIDDASAVSAVTLDGAALIVDRDYVLGPDRGFLSADAAGPIYEWLELVPMQPMSPQMGFTYNLDRLWWKYKHRHSVAVTGTFGWPIVPADVQQAALWTAAYYAETMKPYQSVTVSDFSETLPASMQFTDLPDRALKLLLDYKRVLV